MGIYRVEGVTSALTLTIASAMPCRAQGSQALAGFFEAPDKISLRAGRAASDSFLVAANVEPGIAIFDGNKAGAGPGKPEYFALPDPFRPQ
jgi:hypothetical protein